ncbi:MAG: MBL fold metallo-hydrolase [Spirochaetes bacterium]|nr:MBL fold metallo-hydrolase [Spirochaetota bacterium]
MKEVYPGIFVIVEKGVKYNIPPPANIYVLAGKDGLIYDAGYGRKKAVNKFLSEFKKIENACREKNVPFNITRILPSHIHADHISGLKKIRDSLNLTVLMTEGMSQVITSVKNYKKRYEQHDIQDLFSSTYVSYPVIRRLVKIFYFVFYRIFFGIEFVSRPDEIVNDNETITINGEKWKIFSSPGHCSYHISLYNKKKGVLLGGDNILSSITTWLGPPDSDLDDYEKTLNKIKNLPNLKIILTGHGKAITKPAERIGQILKWRKKRSAQVLQIVNDSGSGITVNKIIRELYRGSGSIRANLSRGWVQLELLHLMKKKLVGRKAVLHKAFFYPLR